MRATARTYALLLVASMASGVLVLLTLSSSPPLLRCNPSLVDGQYYQVNFNIDYATRLDHLYSIKNLSIDDNNTKSIDGKFIMEWLKIDPDDQTGEIQVRILDLVLDQLDDSTRNTGQSAITLRLKMNDDCKLTIAPPTADSEKVQALIARLITLFTFQIPEQYSDRWQAKHKDNMGSYLADYWLANHDSGQQIINRKRDHYFSLSADNKKQGFTPHIIESSTQGHFISGEPWLYELKGIEDTSLLYSGRAVVQTRVRYSVNQMDNGFTWSVMPPVNINNQKIPVTNTSSLEEKVTGNIDINTKTSGYSYYGSIIEKYKDSLATGSMAASLDFLVSSLQKSPNLAYTLKQQILNDTIGHRGTPLVFLALGKSGTDQAFEVLIELLEDSSAPSITQSRAVYALAAARPDSMKVAEVFAMQLDRTGVEHDMASQSALMAMGIMISKIDDEFSPVKMRLRELIEEQLSNANNEQSMRTALAASSNAADEKMYPVIAQQLDHSSPDIRQRVVKTIGKIGPVTSRTELVKIFSDESNTGLRVTSLDSLTTLLNRHKVRANETEISMVVSALKSEEDTQIRASIIRFLGVQSDNSVTRKALIEQVRVEKDPVLLKQLGQVLTPEELMSTN